MSDLISRQAAIDAVEKESQVDGSYGYMDTKSIVDLIEDLPSAQPNWFEDAIPPKDKEICVNGNGCVFMSVITFKELKPKTGHWIEYDNPYDLDGEYYCYCSECMADAHEQTDYCPNCGAKMGGGA